MEKTRNIFKEIKSFSHLIRIMVESLENPSVKVSMDTYGSIHYDTASEKVICYGCAATNVVSNLSKVKFTVDTISPRKNRAKAINHGITSDELLTFENAIDNLRLGMPMTCLRLLEGIEHLLLFDIKETVSIIRSNIDMGFFNSLVRLRTSNYEENLYRYTRLADELEKLGI